MHALRASRGPAPSSVPWRSPSRSSASVPVTMRSRATSQSQTMSPAPTSASARRSVSPIAPCTTAPPAKACCITVKPIRSTISTRPPLSAGCDHVVGERAGDGQIGAEHPDHQQHPGRDQHDSAVVVVQRQVDDDDEADGDRGAERDPRHAGGDARLEHGDAEQDHQADQPGDGRVAVAHMPAVRD